jgi:starvation-inducible DNA-binding protein
MLRTEQDSLDLDLVRAVALPGGGVHVCAQTRGQIIWNKRIGRDKRDRGLGIEKFFRLGADPQQDFAILIIVPGALGLGIVGLAGMREDLREEGLERAVETDDGAQHLRALGAGRKPVTAHDFVLLAETSDARMVGATTSPPYLPRFNPKKETAMGKATEGHIDIGIDEKDRAAIAEGLSRLLADTYTLYLTTHNFHWNVTGPMFNTLHDMFMVQYTELWNSVDLIAERIRSLGHKAPGSYAQFSELASIDDAPADPPKALDMVAILVRGHEAVARTARSIFPLADKASDEPTADLLTQRLAVHEKTAWMLRSLLQN